MPQPYVVGMSHWQLYTLNQQIVNLNQSVIKVHLLLLHPSLLQICLDHHLVKHDCLLGVNQLYLDTPPLSVDPFFDNHLLP